MNEIILFALLGLGTGAVTAGLAISVVVTFRGSGIINLAAGAVAMVAAYAFWAFDSGFFHVTLGTVPAQRDTTLVVARGTHTDWAQLVSRALGTARVEAHADSSRDVDVSVYLGSTWRPPTQPFYP